MTRVFRKDVNEDFEPSLELQRLTLDAEIKQARADELEAARTSGSIPKRTTPTPADRAAVAYKRDGAITRGAASASPQANPTITSQTERNDRALTPLERAALASTRKGEFSRE